MAEDWQDQPPLTRAVVGFAGALVTLSTDGLGYTVRMTGKAETFLDESIGFLQDARPLVVALTEAVESGMIEDIRRVMRITETTVNQIALISARLDSAAGQLAKIVPRVGPVLDGLPQTQEDIRLARDAVQRVESLVTATVSQLDAIPGAKLVKGIGGGVVGGLTGRGKS
ncbi:hypothetical protein EFK50_05775 [Nocardioides marmoriginsengisoli]|uniref:Uncharacterized protein n=1 Tax=Nocardioides marmoriginsengisoli TaxID=661483 RepID=A0A3N0CPS7_9ACTN|nr:hypothetical protein [Nocardioides marmoriginsengisoli]RNL65458.1 hypothetical protein EFK50_05775 [Nocardioides marmoriginsengisoli]